MEVKQWRGSPSCPGTSCRSCKACNNLSANHWTVACTQMHAALWWKCACILKAVKVTAWLWLCASQPLAHLCGKGVLHYEQALFKLQPVCACRPPCSPMQRSDLPVTAQAWSALASLLAAPSWRNTPLQRPPLRCVQRAGPCPLSARAFGSKRLLTGAPESELHCVSGIAQQRAHVVAQGR